VDAGRQCTQLALVRGSIDQLRRRAAKVAKAMGEVLNFGNFSSFSRGGGQVLIFAQLIQAVDESVVISL
jgi:hypothetical protein